MQIKADGSNPRVQAFDWLRVVCTFYIVGFWHLMDYSGYTGYMNAFTERATVIALSLFTLLSGLLIGGARIAPSVASFAGFYRRRFLRIYPPLVLALVTFYLVGLIHVKTLLRALTLSGAFIGSEPPTLWFICVIALFYLLAPVLLLAHSRPVAFWLRAAAVMAAMGAMAAINDNFDTRLLLYFPSFAAGLWLAGRMERVGKRALLALALLAAGGCALSLRIRAEEIESSMQAEPMALFCGLLILCAAWRYGSRLPANRVIGWLSTASMFMYLFHRPVYQLAMAIVPLHDPVQRLLYLLLVCLPLTTALSWLGQIAYDRARASGGLRMADKRIPVGQL